MGAAGCALLRVRAARLASARRVPYEGRRSLTRGRSDRNKPAPPRRRMPLGRNGDGSRDPVPEGAIKLQGTGRQVLERCDGTRTFGEIIAELQKEFGASADPEKIRSDITMFLEQLQRKRIVDY